uniref:Ovule protein n=1 Tax=Schistocephalus solidus TaxID=70667 RepID=A0A183TAP2_SCHSO
LLVFSRLATLFSLVNFMATYCLDALAAALFHFVWIPARTFFTSVQTATSLWNHLNELNDCPNPS